jgi:nucleoside-diphosphate-sugar epimerase
MMKEVSGLEIDAKHGEEVPGEVRKMVLNYAKAKEKLGWIPRIEFKDGLEKSWNYIKSGI